MMVACEAVRNSPGQRSSLPRVSGSETRPKAAERPR